ncbi:AzlC family ABC transporter permease [Ruixingdingia sedimenti]|uniref:AzlC family ABC transporter permease n=1 Tax=Ruixingdingia sedimenti TaxID=3073604 RepID=A0ABU1F9R7_9RHOB|nr:AzlC family ABC transporter permease [Xinfangfangia sp. LG-4]MDR5653169.1 AzlC family ABC transporter permease [Xinfangfangia sp. LG-4]
MTAPDTASTDPLSDARNQFRQGVIACLPTILGYWSIGFASGAIGAVAGFSVLEITLLSGLLYTGSAQFLFYSMASAGAGVWAIVAAVALINLRYLLMSSYLAVYFTRAAGWQKVVGGALLTDETFGVAAQHGARHGALPFAWLLGLNVTAWLNWIVANLMGVALASALPESLTRGLSFSLVAMFIGLLLLTWFASRRKVLETVTILVAMAVVWAGSGHAGANLLTLVATVGAATLATALLRLSRKGDGA